MKVFISVLIITILAASCNQSKSKTDVSDWKKDSLEMMKAYGPNPSQGTLLDVLMPFIAKKHDSIPNASRFDSIYKAFYDGQKLERQYKIMYSGIGKDSAHYLMVSRLEPSIKNDKYASVCIKYKLNGNGLVDTSTYEELFWTWKMLMSELNPKSAELFRKAIKNEDLSQYYPGEGKEEYIMFPDGNAYFDKSSKSWKTKGTL